MPEIAQNILAAGFSISLTALIILVRCMRYDAESVKLKDARNVANQERKTITT